MENTQLSSTVTVKQYREFRNNNDVEKIADLIFERFNERYIEPFKDNRSKHGFSMIAISCLMLEALHSFKKGWKQTCCGGGKAFEEFFSDSKYFQEFKGIGQDFYSNVRCGVLHQAETYNGWKIVRKGSLLNKSEKMINATIFLNALNEELKYYTDFLRQNSIKSEVWQKTIKKLDYICSNTGSNRKQGNI